MFVVHKKVNIMIKVNIMDYQHILETVFDGRVMTVDNRGPDPGVDEWFGLQVGDDVWHLAIEHKTSTGNAVDRFRTHQNDLRAQWPEAIPVLAVPRLTKRERQTLRDHQINHMDLAGNVWIRSPGLVVRTEGARPPQTRRPSRGRNPFSKKASLVSRVLLAHPSSSWRVRDISEEASLSVGYSSEVLQSLVERGYAAETPDGFRLEDPVALLIEWSGVYRWEDNQIHSFMVSLGKDELVVNACDILRTEGAECLLTLLSAADQIMEYVEHDQVHIYASDLTRAGEDALRSNLHAEPVERGGNLHVLKPYYGEAVWYGAEDVDGVSSVSDIQLFLDLIHYPVRGPEAAAALLKRRLGPRLELSAEQMRILREGVAL